MVNLNQKQDRFNNLNGSGLNLPRKNIIENSDIPKAKCSDPSHGERDLLEGETVYAILSEEDQQVSVESISCIQCSAQSIYERANKNNNLFIVKAILATDSIEDTSYDLQLNNITILDTYTS